MGRGLWIEVGPADCQESRMHIIHETASITYLD